MTKRTSSPPSALENGKRLKGEMYEPCSSPKNQLGNRPPKSGSPAVRKDRHTFRFKGCSLLKDEYSLLNKLGEGTFGWKTFSLA